MVNNSRDVWFFLFLYKLHIVFVDYTTSVDIFGEHLEEIHSQHLVPSTARVVWVLKFVALPVFERPFMATSVPDTTFQPNLSPPSTTSSIAATPFATTLIPPQLPTKQPQSVKVCLITALLILSIELPFEWRPMFFHSIFIKARDANTKIVNRYQLSITPSVQDLQTTLPHYSPPLCNHSMKRPH